MRRAMRVLAVAAVVAGALTFSAPANAGSYNGECESSGGGEVCLYWAGINSSVYDTLYSKSDYNGSTFYRTNEPIDNNIRGVWNRDPDTSVKLFYNAGYSGLLRTIGAGQKVDDLGIARNAASSHCFTSNAACP